MSNELTTSPFGAVSIMDEEALAESLAENSDFGARTSGISYMSFSGKKGIYSIGTAGRSPAEDEPFLVAIPLFKTGYICWKGGRPISKRLAGPREPKIMAPDPEEGGPFDTNRGEGWFEARSMGARSLINGEEVEFTINSKSGVSVIADLHKECAARIRAREAAWPIITFGTEQFESSGYRNDKPKITPIKWLTSQEAMKWTSDEFDPVAAWLSDTPAESSRPSTGLKPRPKL